MGVNLTDQQLEALNAFWDGLEPEPMLMVSEWADEHRQLSQKSSAEPGKWRTSRTPYLRAIMDALSPASKAQQVVFMAGAQVGKTESGNNWVGYVVDHAPGPMLLVQPTVDIAKRLSKQRLAPLFQETPRLAGKIKDSRSRDSGNTTLMKEFPGGVMIITGANSAAGLRSMPARYLFLDEVDAYPEDVDGEGEPCDLAIARSRTFSRRKIFKCSTPTFKGRSRIEAAYLESNQQRYYVPCPHCGHMQPLVWAQLIYSPKAEPTEAHYVCRDCGALIEEHHKEYMLERGDWVAEQPDQGAGKIIGFHLNSLYSPIGWFSWLDAAKQWVAAQESQSKLRVFTNTVLGETWVERGDAPDWRRLYDRRESYTINTVPAADVLFLTAGVDVQKDRLEVEVVGWCRGKRSYSIDYRVFLGDHTDKGPTGPWAQIDAMLAERWVHPGGVEMQVSVLAVDASAYTMEVRDWARNYPMSRVMAIKGEDGMQTLLTKPRPVDVNLGGKTIKRGLHEWTVGVNVAKAEVYGWLQLARPTVESGQALPAGFMHFPQYPQEFFEQLTAEALVSRLVRGYRRYMWEKTRPRNEALDCRIYSRIAAAAFGIDRFKETDWAQLERTLAIQQTPVDTNAQSAASSMPQSGQTKRRQRSSFWG